MTNTNVAMGLESHFERQDVVDVTDNMRKLRKATDFYFKPKKFEDNGKIYDNLGLKYFGKLYNATYGKAVLFAYRLVEPKLRSNWVNTNSEFDTNRFDVTTRLMETIHTQSFCALAYDSIQDFSNGDIQNGVIKSLGNIAVNLYPIMLLRKNRARTQKVLDRKFENIKNLGELK